MKRFFALLIAVCMTCVSVFANYPEVDYTAPESYEQLKTELVRNSIDKEKLDSFKGVHPRILLDSESVAALRESIKNENAHRWSLVKKTADGYLETEPPEYYISTNKEENWMRAEADKIPFFAFCYLMTGEEKYYNAAEKWALKMCSYPTWGLKDSNYYNKDLACSHCLTGIGLFYDWCFDKIPPRAKATILNTLISRGTTMSGEGWWRGSYLQNHSWWAWSSMTVAGAAIMDEYPKAKTWFEKAVKGWDNVYWMIDEDGGAHEGVLYWRYGLNPFVMFHMNAEKFFGIDYSQSGYDKNNWKYPVYIFFGKDTWSNTGMYLNFADAARSTSWMEIDSAMAYFASKYQNGYAAKFENDMMEYIERTGSPYSWLSLLFADSLPEAKSYDDLPTSILFEGLGYVFVHSDFGGSESVLGMRCGNAMGTEWLGKSRYNPGSSHVHQDLNHLLLFGNGEWLLRDDGYVTKVPEAHSTLMVDGTGQLKSTANADISIVPKILKYKDCEDYTYFSGDAAVGYKTEQEVEKFVRHVIFLKKLSTLLIFDDVKTGSEKELTLRFMPESKNYLKQDDKTYLFTGSKAKMRVSSLSDDASEMKATLQALNFGETCTLDITKKADEWKHMTAISWSAKADNPQNIICTETNNGSDCFEFEIGAYKVRFNAEKGDVEYIKPTHDLNVRVDGEVMREYRIPPEMNGESAYLPLRDIFEFAGFKVGYSEADNSVTISGSGYEKKVSLNSEGILEKDGCAMVDSDRFREYFGGVCSYDGSGNLYNIKLRKFGTSTKLKSAFLDGIEISGLDSESRELFVTAAGKPKEGIDTGDLIAMGEDEGATVSVKQTEKNKFIITVVAEDGVSSADYTLTVNRPVGLGDVPICDVYASGDDGNLPRNSVDGLADTRWSSNGEGEYIVYELDGSYRLSEMRISYASTDKRGTKAVLYVSEDGENYTEVMDISSKINDEMPKVFRINNVKCRFVKIIGGGNTANTWNSYVDVGFKGQLEED